MADLGANSGRFRIERVGATGSTNADVLARARHGEPDGLVLVADHQHAGRGRLGRVWEAPPGTNLLVSLLLRPHLPPAEWFRCTSAVAVATVDACAARGVDARVKWPNDVVVPDDGGAADRAVGGTGAGKLGGILAESVVDGPGGSAVVVGLGCNVGWPAAGEYPGATSLAAHGVHVRPADLLEDLLARVDELAPDLHDCYRARCATIGRPVSIVLPGGEEVDGFATDVDETGRLVVDTASGRRAFSVGDVVHARAAR